MNMRLKKRHGFSLTEIVVVLIIIGILALVGIGFGANQISTAKMNTMESNLRIIGSDIEKAIVDLGFLDNIDDTEYVHNYFDLWDYKYTTCRLDVDNMRIVPKGGSFGADYSGVILKTVDYKDPWNMELQIYYMIPASGGEYRIIVASAGPNSYFAADATNGYINGEYEDDVLIAMMPRAN